MILKNVLKKHRYKCVVDIFGAIDSEIKALDFKDAPGNVIELKTYDLVKIFIFR